jgi:MoaA/NifB/PqqE/SkfB family radical SAM enzyme
MMETPLYPLEGVVSWNMNTTCNYRCSYCTQRFVDDRGQWAKDLPHFIDAFLSLSGDWEIKLSGGEPFRHPDFIEAIAKLSAGGMRVSVVTNLSSSDEELERFAAATASRPGLLSASLHLEYCEPEAFLAKLLRFQESYKGRVCVTSVATREQLPMLPELKALFSAAGVTFKIQPEKQERDVIDYSPQEREQLVVLGGHNSTGRIAPNLKGRPCWAGSRYFIVDHKGDAYRCYPARRYREEFLGNLLDGSLRLGNAATECNYNYCNCTVPQERGMVDGSSRC